MGFRKTKFNPENDLGFGGKAISKNQRLLNQDGSVNVRRKGLPFFDTSNNYHRLITMKWANFWLLVLSGYFIVNLIFAGIYMAIGVNSLIGAQGHTWFEHYWDAFFFSAQTLSTVGYGHIYPYGFWASTVSAIESMIGLLGFALATGLLYGRFSKPSARIIYSKEILVAPYRDDHHAFMFRLANRRRSTLIDLQIELNLSYLEDVEGTPIRRFMQLDLERKQVSLLSVNWTVVHPLNDKSPLKDVTLDELIKAEATFTVLLKAFDDTFAQTVHSRFSYQYDEIVWGAKFKPAFDRDADGYIVLDLSRIGEYDRIELPVLNHEQPQA